MIEPSGVTGGVKLECEQPLPVTNASICLEACELLRIRHLCSKNFRYSLRAQWTYRQGLREGVQEVHPTRAREDESICTLNFSVMKPKITSGPGIGLRKILSKTLYTGGNGRCFAYKRAVPRTSIGFEDTVLLWESSLEDEMMSGNQRLEELWDAESQDLL